MGSGPQKQYSGPSAKTLSLCRYPRRMDPSQRKRSNLEWGLSLQWSGHSLGTVRNSPTMESKTVVKRGKGGKRVGAKKPREKTRKKPKTLSLGVSLSQDIRCLPSYHC